jgi:homoserine kinase
MQTAAALPGPIVVPGSISNLGPAFDALSVAVSVYLRITVVTVLPESPGLLDMDFKGGAPSGENRIATGFRRAEARFGRQAPGVRVEVETEIPMRAGLGSSAAATIAGIRLYEAVTEPRDAGGMLKTAAEIEGHPDNAAAALLGGLTLSCQHDDGCITARAWAWPGDLRFVVATPGAELETAFARRVLPADIPMKDAVFNLQRALLLLRALETGEYGLLREALRDRWHQPARQQYVPGLADALRLDHPSLFGICLSGAGPSIAVLTGRGGEDDAANALTRIYERLSLPVTIRRLSAHPPISSSGMAS